MKKRIAYLKKSNRTSRMKYHRNEKLSGWGKIIYVKISDKLRKLSRIKHKEIRHMKRRRTFKDKEDIWEETAYVSSRRENREKGERHYSEIQPEKFMELKK